MNNRENSFQISSFNLSNDGGRPNFIKIEVASKRPLCRLVYLSPHRKNFFMLIYVKRGSGKHWVDMVPYELKPKTFYFTTPEQIHLNDDAILTGTTIALSRDLFALEDTQHLEKLSLLQNFMNVNELSLSQSEKKELEATLKRIVNEYRKKNDYSDGLLYAHLRVLIIFLSGIYKIQYNINLPFDGRDLYHRFSSCVDGNYKRMHKVGQYAKLLNCT